MFYIGFSTQSHKISARLFCKKFRHCAPLYIGTKKCILYQFVSLKKITPIPIRRRDIKILSNHSWIFVKYKCKPNLKHALQAKNLTCVQFTKSVCNIKNKSIQTPDALFRYINNKRI